MDYTIEQKYNFLLNLIEIDDIDLWEYDAMLFIPRQYFQLSGFAGENNAQKDIAVEWIMKDRGE